MTRCLPPATAASVAAAEPRNPVPAPLTLPGIRGSPLVGSTSSQAGAADQVSHRLSTPERGDPAVRAEAFALAFRGRSRARGGSHDRDLRVAHAPPALRAARNVTVPAEPVVALGGRANRRRQAPGSIEDNIARLPASAPRPIRRPTGPHPGSRFSSGGSIQGRRPSIRAWPIRTRGWLSTAPTATRASLRRRSLISAMPRDRCLWRLRRVGCGRLPVVPGDD